MVEINWYAHKISSIVNSDRALCVIEYGLYMFVLFFCGAVLLINCFQHTNWFSTINYFSFGIFSLVYYYFWRINLHLHNSGNSRNSDKRYCAYYPNDSDACFVCLQLQCHENSLTPYHINRMIIIFLYTNIAIHNQLVWMWMCEDWAIFFLFRHFNRLQFTKCLWRQLACGSQHLIAVFGFDMLCACVCMFFLKLFNFYFYINSLESGLWNLLFFKHTYNFLKNDPKMHLNRHNVVHTEYSLICSIPKCAHIIFN